LEIKKIEQAHIRELEYAALRVVRLD